MSLAKIERHLESNGWTRKVAGDADFDAALLAIERMAATGKGLIVSGEYGVGKTALAAIAARAFGGGVFKVRLAIPDDLDRLTRSWQEYYVENPYAQNAWLDDLGAENPVSDFGIRLERAGDFVVTWHELHRPGTRLIVTTNLTTAELDARYGGRVLSRLKDLCVPLRLSGGDKRKWTTGKPEVKK